jgi:DNA-binding NtrC family response regulator
LKNDRRNRGGKVPGLDALKGRLVLAVEEQDAIHGALVERALTQAGARLAGPFNSCTDAVSWLERNTPDLAVIDVTLGDEPCEEVARELRQNGIPFVVFSTFEHDRAPPEFRNAPWIQKPAMDHLVIALSEAARLAS